MNKKTNSDPAFAGHVYVRHPHERARVLTPVRGKSMTHQSHKDLCDINSIVRRFENTGQLPESTKQPQYADVSALQSDLTERINESRAVLDQAGRALHEKQAADKAAQEKQLADDAAELERLRSFEQSVKENRET